ALRQRLAARSPLIGQKLVHIFEDPSQASPTLISRYLRIDDRIAHFLLDSDDLDSRLLPYAKLITPRARLADIVLPPEETARLASLARHSISAQTVLYFHGPYGSGKQTAAEAICAETGLRLLEVDGEQLVNLEPSAFDNLMRIALREAKLHGA